MAIKDVFKVNRKTFINPTAWIDFDALRDQNILIWSVIKSIFTKPTPDVQETFEEAQQRLGLTDEDVTATAHRYRLIAILFFILGFLAFCYGFFLLFRHASITGWLLTFGVCGLCLSQAYQYDFWSLQMRQRKLGLTFTDWQESILGK